MANDNGFTVSAGWLEQNLGKPGLSIVDAAWYLPAQNREARAEYEAGHIPGAVFFDHDKVVEPDVDLPHALPKPETFARVVGAMGIAETDTIVVYDGFGLFSAPRAWWMFRVMGARDVKVLDGGLDGWKRDGRSLTAEPTKIAPNVFKAEFDPDRVASLDDMKAIVASGGTQVADARSAGRFEGREPEPRAGLKSGHMPGAANVPFASLSEDGVLLPPERLEAVLREAGIDPAQPVVTTCGSGISAAVITLALETLGNRDTRLYDGAWAEWGGRDDTEIATGPAGSKDRA